MNREKRIPELNQILAFEQFLNRARGVQALNDRTLGSAQLLDAAALGGRRVAMLYGEGLEPWYNAYELLDLFGYEDGEGWFHEHACDFEWRFMVRPLGANPYLIDIAPFVSKAVGCRLLEGSPCREDKALEDEVFGVIPRRMACEAHKSYRGGGRCE
ncbi:hypothetical protein [Eubacterium sp. 1001713B170207_170306_E7]|uniref:hypothetical protein n=1 Tax=Eubacterium sp. 1001713B170207_170306_E7 TaxID=2787097 RepID=UPI00189B95BB|nr:hypothetical protein [Eubacterium sp. 1001713B170207_170306_E7]